MPTPHQFFGRTDDVRWIAEKIRAAADGRGGVGAIYGDAGMGKTALVEATLSHHPEIRIIRLTGVEMEADLPFGFLQRLVIAHRPYAESLPPSQRDALLIATGLSEGDPSDRSVVGLALLTFLFFLTEDVPVACVIDDAQWIDAESLGALAFVGRRLLAERLLLIFVARSEIPELAGFPVLHLTGLDPDSSARLLTAASAAPTDPWVTTRIVEATGGNPLALTDLGAELTTRELRGEALLPQPMPLGKHLEAHYADQARRLPQDSQMWLVIAAAEPDGQVHTIGAAARALGLRTDASWAAEENDLVRIAGDRVAFRHPLIRSAVYNGASSHDVRTAHEKLAWIARERHDLDRWATHLSISTVGPDDRVADELELAAERAERRGGHDSRTSFLIRAAALSEDIETRHRRTLAAGEAAIAAGAGAQAASLLKLVRPDLLDDADRGRLEVCKSDLSVLTPTGDTTFATRARRLLDAARLSRSASSTKAKEALLYAFWALVQADALVTGTSSREIAEEARSLVRQHPADDLITRSLDATSTLILDGPVAAAALVRDVVALSLDPTTPDDDVLKAYICVAYPARLLHDAPGSMAVLNRAEIAARTQGAIWILCRVLVTQANFQSRTGQLSAGKRCMEEARDLIGFIGTKDPFARIITTIPTVRVWWPEEALSAGEAQEIREDARRLGYGLRVATSDIADMLISIAESRYADAWRAGVSIAVDDWFHAGTQFLPDIIEAAARSGHLAEGRHLLRRFEAASDGTANAWRSGLAMRCRALLADDDDAGAIFARSVALLDEAGVAVDKARTQQLYGEWLRRRRRRAAAVDQLQAAHSYFSSVDAVRWTARAQRELAAAGTAAEAAPRRMFDFTPQELAVAVLAAQGTTNSDIAAQLFISPSTVDYHLRKVFRKLGVTSRRQLDPRLLE
ncbi:LuxR family transcriptional regulator [Microbacterium sp. 3J1]|uniref:helix-turn-helix transcriptional regulator n=1 Tax=Microbacterium sp. 3J1 TaxID=861269 RepID=UPI000A8E5610|nr:LuxR family transcriptional regulator [Microbacterium sp. 3J1]